MSLRKTEDVFDAYLLTKNLLNCYSGVIDFVEMNLLKHLSLLSILNKVIYRVSQEKIVRLLIKYYKITIR